MSILDQFYNGEIELWRRPPAYHNEIKSIADCVAKYRETLLAELNDSQKELLEKFEDTLLRRCSIDERYSFRIGFSLGVRMTAESFTTET